MSTLFLLAVLAATPAAPPAAADPKEHAKEVFAAGKKLYDQGKYGDAVLRFEEAYALKPHPVIFFNIGKCYEQLGNPAKAMRAYRDYLRGLPDATDRDAVSDAVANLERKLRERGVQQLMIFTDPSKAHVEVDGKSLGDSPTSVELSAGEHKLAVRLDGYQPVERNLTMNIQRTSEMTINLTRSSSDELHRPAAGDAPVAEAGVTPGASTTSPALVVKPAARSAERKRLFTWVAAGVAAGGLGAGIGFGVVSSGASNELRATTHTRAEADAIVGRTQGMALGSNVAYGVAAAAGVTAVVLFFLEGRP